MYPPSPLKKGDLILLIAPSGLLKSSSVISKAKNMLEADGYKVEVGQHVERAHFGFAGTDQERLEDLQWALDHPQARVIWCLRGGYGITRIVDLLSLEGMKRQTKWLVGFSDITALQLKLTAEGIPCVHGPMPVKFLNRTALDYLNTLHFLKNQHLVNAYPMFGGPPHEKGIHAKMTGGNLTMVCDSLGTQNEIQSHGKILFLEDVDEKPYRLDRMITQLDRAGKFKGIEALITGTFTGCEDEDGTFPKNHWRSCFLKMAEKHSFPYFPDLPMGHGVQNYPLVFGLDYHISYENGLLRLEVGDKD